jgi:hypothetical protein
VRLQDAVLRLQLNLAEQGMYVGPYNLDILQGRVLARVTLLSAVDTGGSQPLQV